MILTMGIGTWMPTTGQICHISNLLMVVSKCQTNCATLNYITKVSGILSFCSIPMALHLSFSVKRCITALEDRNSINVGLWISRGLKQMSCEHYSNRLTRLAINSCRTLFWDVEHFMSWPSTTSCWIWGDMIDWTLCCIGLIWCFERLYDINKNHQFLQHVRL